MELKIILLWVYAVAQAATTIILQARGWWRSAPAFMVFMAVSTVQGAISIVGRPHTMEWWRYSWAPIEALLMVAAVAACIEVLVWRTRFMDQAERFSWRFCVMMVSIGIVGFNWDVQAKSAYGWIVYSREYIWVGLAVMMGMSLVIFARKPVLEPNGLRAHAYILGALVFIHAVVAPLARLGYDTHAARSIYQAITILCCVAWIMFCSPRASVSYVQKRPSLPGQPSSRAYHS